MHQPQLIVVAGPNGVGKTTYSRTAFESGVLLVDPDRYSVRAEHATSMEAGRLAVRRVREALSRCEDFVLETTLSGKSPIHVIGRAKSTGYDVTLLYIGIDDPDECVRRVRRRVQQGGHGVPETDIRRRFVRSIDALPKAIDAVDRVFLHDNAVHAPYRLVAQTDFREIVVAEEMPPVGGCSDNRNPPTVARRLVHALLAAFPFAFA
jgi:predicted ABC-type ATPase